MDNTWYLLLTMMIICSCSRVDIERNDEDTTFGWIECTGFDRAVPAGVIYRTCTCQGRYTTMMSKGNEEYDCLTPKEVGCDYSLTESKQAYLVTTTNVNRQIISNIGDTVSSLQRILVWNLYPGKKEIGNWVDITDITTPSFSINVQSNTTSLIISSLSTTTWEGLVIKIELGIRNSSKNCLILKVKGRTSYPTDIYKRLGIPPTTKAVETISRTTAGRHRTLQTRSVSSVLPTTTPTAAMYPWILQEEDVCFGTMSESFGTFLVKQDGVIVAMRLVHKSGYVNCRQGDPTWRSRWGCRGIKNSLGVIITDQSNAVVFPRGVEIKKGFYQLPGYNGNKKSVVFTDSVSPMYATNSMQLRLWYGADLFGVSEDDDGSVCVDVYAKFNAF